MYSLYNVVITNNSNTTAPSDGFIDSMTITQYEAAGAASPANLAASLAKTRANYRYKLLCQQLSLMGNIYTLDMDAVGADCNTAATAFTFTAQVEHGDDSLYVYDETNANALLVGLPALVRMIARALVLSETTTLLFLDPTATAAPGNPMLYQRVGYRSDIIQVGAVAANLTAANSMITVTKIL